VEEKTG